MYGALESPNAVFWALAAILIGAVAASAQWASVAPALVWIGRPVPLGWALPAARVLTAGMGAIAILAVALMLAQPARVGLRFTIVLMGWRVVRFLFTVLAAWIVAWVLLVGAAAAVGFYKVYGDRVSTPTSIKVTLLVVPMFGVLGLVIKRTIGDLLRLAQVAVATRRADRWARARLAAASPPTAPANHRSPQVLILSDLHATAPGQLTLEGDLTDDAMGRFVSDTIAAFRPTLLIGAGDLTDTGHPAAWQRVGALFAAAGTPLLAAPGNHDVNFAVYERPPSRVAALLDGFDLDPVGRGSYDRKTLTAHLGQLATATGVTATGTFPQLHEVTALRLTVLLLDSNRRPSGWAATNAIGSIGDDQLRAARRLLAGRRRDHALVIVLHHHVFPADAPASSAWARWKQRVANLPLVCVDGGAVVALAFEHDAAAIIHGHKHMPYVRELVDGDRRLRLISVGSALYPAKGPCAAEVGAPSVMGLVLEDGRLRDVTLHRPDDHRPDDHRAA